ncbi:hypothetical protein [Nonomuraea dietziae]|uniref:hypothetical protein n=1 Tax=Nonomuraea dietziae TaxID=65515 RepID=UPI00340B67E2
MISSTIAAVVLTPPLYLTKLQPDVGLLHLSLTTVIGMLWALAVAHTFSSIECLARRAATSGDSRACSHPVRQTRSEGHER